MGSQPSFSKTNMTTLERIELFGYNGVGFSFLKISFLESVLAESTGFVQGCFALALGQQDENIHTDRHFFG